MSKHVIDGLRTRTSSERLAHYVRIDRETSGHPSRQSDKLRRETRTRQADEKLRRYTEIDRKD